VLAALLELDPRAGDEILDRARDEHLSRARERGHARTRVDRDSFQLLADELALAGVETRPDLQAQRAQCITTARVSI
jgi:hypothetical protein